MKTGSPCLPNGLSVLLPCLVTSHLGKSLCEGQGGVGWSKAGDFPLFAALVLFLFLAERAVCTADALCITITESCNSAAMQPLCHSSLSKGAFIVQTG